MWIGTLNIVKMLVLPNLIYRFNAIPIKIPASYFVDISKLILKLIWRDKRPRIKLLELISDKSKVARYKINIQKSIAFPDTSNE